MKKNNSIRRKIIKITIVIFVLIFIISLFKIYQSIEVEKPSYNTTRTLYTKSDQTVENETEKSQKIVDMIEETTKKVVGISKLKSTGSTLLTGASEKDLGLGSGVIVTQNGYILSNEHVTGGKYSKCYITLEDGQNYEGTVAWSDQDLDLSLTKINAENLPYIELGNSDTIKIGETVYAIGNPIGYEFRRTVTSGIISAKNRTIKIEEAEKTSYMSNLIQTDATINPGNSGGPLIYANGEMIGINTVKISTAEGIGFAIPINVIKNVIKSYEETNNFEEATLGIYAYDGTAVQYLGNNTNNNLATTTVTQKGIYVDQIIKKGPADNTELKQGDIITKIDEREIATVNDLRKYIFTKKPAEEVTLEINRGKITKTIKIKLGKK